jgi:DNA-binding Lrp family transcriptional regulator
MTYRIDAMDKALLEQIQDGIPLTRQVWDHIGQPLGISGSEVLRRLRILRAEQVLRSIGPVIEPQAVGLGASSLIALRVPAQRLLEVASIVNEYEEVSHNYRRNHAYNLWFTLTGASPEDLERIREEIRIRAGLNSEDMLHLPRKKRFKIGVRFRIRETGVRKER